MRIGIVGFGSIARRHLQNIRLLKPKARIVVCHLYSRGRETPAEADETVYGLESLAAKKPEVAFLTGPATTHLLSGLAMLACGADIFVEKPIAHTLEGLDQLEAACQQADRLLMLGYNLRFHRPLQVLKDIVESGKIGRVQSARLEVGQYLPDWRPHLDYRQSVTARRELGGGVLLEISHEIDYLRWILGDFSAVWGRVERLGDLEIDVEDTAEMILTGQNRAAISLHLDMLQRSSRRVFQIHGSEGSLIWKYGEPGIKLYLAQEGAWQEIAVQSGIERNDMYVAELQHFFECVESRRQPCIGYKDGHRVLEVIAAVRRSSQDGCEVAL
ncbi:MAG: Gfo/Idh/MocA family oxidoreductase [Gallionellaceae bacterium]